MTSWDTAAFGRGLTAMVIAVGLALGAAACSHGGREQDRPGAAAPQAGSGSAPREQLQTDQPLADLQGQDGLSLTITSAERAPAGYVTVRGDLKNDGAVTAVVPAELRGDELKVLRTGPSLAGATLVDFAHKKRYYVLRDTEGRPPHHDRHLHAQGRREGPRLHAVPSASSEHDHGRLPDAAVRHREHQDHRVR